MDDARVDSDGLFPVAIGGVGGSGTRLVAGLVRALGYYMGDDLNHASDNLWFTLLFKRLEILQADETEFDHLAHAMVAAMRGGSPLPQGLEARVRQLAEADRDKRPASWLQARADSLIAAARRPPHRQPWGWKEPNTHVVIERLWQRLPDLRYIHVVRNGVDMAYSSNQNQLRLWGPHLLNEDGPVTPSRSLAYWCHVHKRMRRLPANNPQRMYWLDYDALCRDRRAEIDKLCLFLDRDPARVSTMLEQVRAPSKRDGVDLNDFDPRDMDYVRSLGNMTPP